MRHHKIPMAMAAALGLLVLPMGGCEEEDPVEESIEETEDAVEDAGEDIEDAVDDDDLGDG